MPAQPLGQLLPAEQPAIIGFHLPMLVEAILAELVRLARLDQVELAMLKPLAVVPLTMEQDCLETLAIQRAIVIDQVDDLSPIVQASPIWLKGFQLSAPLGTHVASVDRYHFLLEDY